MVWCEILCKFNSTNELISILNISCVNWALWSENFKSKFRWQPRFMLRAYWPIPVWSVIIEDFKSSIFNSTETVHWSPFVLCLNFRRTPTEGERNLPLMRVVWKEKEKNVFLFNWKTLGQSSRKISPIKACTLSEAVPRENKSWNQFQCPQKIWKRPQTRSQFRYCKTHGKVKRWSLFSEEWIYNNWYRTQISKVEKNATHGFFKTL